MCGVVGKKKKKVREGTGDPSDKGLESCGVWDLVFGQRTHWKLLSKGAPWTLPWFRNGKSSEAERWKTEGSEDSDNGELLRSKASTGDPVWPPRTCGRVVSQRVCFSATSALEELSLLQLLLIHRRNGLHRHTDSNFYTHTCVPLPIHVDGVKDNTAWQYILSALPLSEFKVSFHS